MNRRGTLSDRNHAAMLEALAGRKSALQSFIIFAGPAVIASIAYMDPGNFATNIQAGSKFGYSLLWVVVLANLIAMLFQGLSAKLGIVTGKNLAEMCRERFSKPVVMAMWVVSEIAAMATDLAEFLGGAIGLSLLFGMPLILGMTVTAVITYVILGVERSGFRPMEIIIAVFVGIIAVCYIAELFIAPIDWADVASGLVAARMPNAEAVAIAVGIIGATVMPHAIYLHSGLTQGRFLGRDVAEKRKLVGLSNREVVIALALAGVVNAAMVVMASSAFHAGHSEVAAIETAYHTLTPLLGIGAAGIFLLSLIASGISSSVVGTMAGQVIMQGFVGFRIPLWVRRLVTMVPAFIVVGLGLDATRSLVLSQVVLSIALPVPMIALLLFTRDRKLMGELANKPLTDVVAWTGTGLVLALNLVLILSTIGVQLPFIG